MKSLHDEIEDKPWLRAALCMHMVKRAGGAPNDVRAILGVTDETLSRWATDHSAEMLDLSHRVDGRCARKVARRLGKAKVRRGTK